VPSAALTAICWRRNVIFLVSHERLTQYVFGVDRMNVKIAALYDSYHPAVLRLVLEVIEQGLRQGIPVGMCGELAVIRGRRSFCWDGAAQFSNDGIYFLL